VSKYDDLKVFELQDLCRERDLKTGRSKAEMIARLLEADAAEEIKEFYGDAPAPLPDGVLPASEAELEAADPEPAPKPAQADPEPSQPDFWVVKGGFTIRVDRHGKLDEKEHRHNLREVKEQAEAAGFSTYGPAFRVKDPDTQTWVYRINVR